MAMSSSAAMADVAVRWGYAGDYSVAQVKRTVRLAPKADPKDDALADETGDGAEQGR
jgi:hypothetical protein